MPFTAPQLDRLQRFFQRISEETYPEEPSGSHTDISNAMIDRMTPLWKLPPSSRVLDVGCGQGLALRRFAERSWEATGVTLNMTDVDACRAQGLNVFAMDQSFLDFPDHSFDLVWCRHCLEHSVIPLLTLAEFRRVMKPLGWLYVEVPAPDTLAKHEENRNHYSVLGQRSWHSLINRSGFAVLEGIKIDVTLPIGPDHYWAFHCRAV